jgi:hypothetical protein
VSGKVLKKAAFDLEATGLLNEFSIDYSAVPYKLKTTFLVHCGVVIDIDTREVFKFVGHKEIMEGMIPLLTSYDVIVAHNGINYDLMVLSLAFNIPFSIRDNAEDWDMFNNKPIKIVDTYVLSKTLNPDRKAHSMAFFGELLGYPKIDWRAEAVALGLIKQHDPRGAEFAVYHPKMLDYNVRDVEVNIETYHFLLKEWGTWPWRDAFILESQVAEVITRQTQRGFNFDEKLAEANVRELDILMEEARVLVEPFIPPKKPTKGASAAYCAPKLQLKKDGSISGVMAKWLDKFEGTHEKVGDKVVVKVFGKSFTLPMTQETFLTSVPAKVSDTTHIKEWLVDLGWEPIGWKERDLSVDTKKVKLTAEKYITAAERYIEQTLNSPFCKFRCERLSIKPQRTRAGLEAALRNRLLNSAKPVGKVYTNPTFTMGVEKETCPSLELMAEDFPHAKILIDYLTYRHRRNSILGGGYDPDDIDDEDESDPSKGFIAFQREDGRIPTPADTCGAGTSRFKHRLVANVPRNTSLYGERMRALFGVADGCYQMGYDFDSLEAKIEAHYCLAEAKVRNKAKVGKLAAAVAYANSLTANKPFDVHTLTAKKISDMIGMNFSRGSAKNVKYGCSYGAQAGRVKQIVGCEMEVAEMIFDGFWESAKPLADFKEALTEWWKEFGGKKFIKGIDGRKIPTRSPHALVNSAFQSAGVICAKKAMVLHDRKLRDAGLLIDFFTNDFNEVKYCQQMIAYHDEAQCEISKSLVKFKMFDTEDDAQVFKNAQSDIWSDIGHSKGDRYFVAYTQAGELAAQAVKEAGEHFGLEVELTAGYVIGQNWGNCH